MKYNKKYCVEFEIIYQRIVYTNYVGNNNCCYTFFTHLTIITKLLTYMACVDIILDN